MVMIAMKTDNLEESLSKRPEFKAYIGKVKDLIVDMKNQLMCPTTFSKIK